MLRILLTTTAFVALGTTGVMAQDQQPDQSQETQPELEAHQPGETATGRQVPVNSGDTLVIAPDQSGAFTLNFQLGQTGIGATQEDANTDTTAAPGVPLGLQEGDPEQLSTENLIDSAVYGANDENIGSVGDVLLTEDGQVDAMVVDVGGFLGIGTRHVAIGVDNLEFMIDDAGSWYVFTPFTQEELEAQPQYDEQTYLEQRQDQRLTADQPM